jgi:asparagine synthase (glutamine-hydrolysing)
MIIRIPPERRTRTDELKQLFIESIRDLLPPETLKDRKRGFVLPTGRWLRDKLRPLVEELCSRDSLEKQNIFLPDVFDTLVLPSLEGKAEGSWKLWTLLCFQLWYFRQQG